MPAQWSATTAAQGQNLSSPHRDLLKCKSLPQCCIQNLCEIPPCLAATV